jgi:hypothetical protein
LLTQLSALRHLLTEKGERQIREVLADNTGPDPLSSLRDRTEHLSSTAELYRIGCRIDELPSCVLASRLRELINDTVGDPLAIPKNEILDGIEVARRLEAALRLLAALHVDLTRALEWLQDANRHGRLSKEHASWCDAQADAFDSLLDTIERDCLHVIEVEERVKRGEVIRDSLMRLKAKAGGGREREGAQRPTVIEQVNAALAVLGLPQSPIPTWGEIEQRKRDLWKKHSTDDPVNRTTPEKLRANTERMQEINGAMEVLKEHKDKLVDAMA